MSVPLVSRWREDDKSDNRMMGTPGAVQQISWHWPYDWGKLQKPSIRKQSRALSSMTSHCFKWGLSPPNEVSRATLPALLAKPIGPNQKSLLNNLRSKNSGSATLKKFCSWELILEVMMSWEMQWTTGLTLSRRLSLYYCHAAHCRSSRMSLHERQFLSHIALDVHHSVSLLVAWNVFWHVKETFLALCCHLWTDFWTSWKNKKPAEIHILKTAICYAELLINLRRRRVNALAAADCNKRILKLMDRCDKCLNGGGDYVEK